MTGYKSNLIESNVSVICGLFQNNYEQFDGHYT